MVVVIVVVAGVVEVGAGLSIILGNRNVNFDLFKTQAIIFQRSFN